ncbi:MAG: SpoIID/LytB domain-containing protein [Desulfobacterales bacterium]|nr:SpoIID/LytB domain-containing protein [Desulfobacterales bacterium]
MKRLALPLTLLILLSVSPTFGQAETHTGTTLFQQATALLAQNNPLEAASLYRQILEKSVDREERAKALLFSATLYNRYLQLPDTAASCLSQITTTYSDTLLADDAAFALGVLAYQRSHFQEAVSRFETYIARYPGSMRTSSARQWLREARKNLGQAMESPLPLDSVNALPQTVRVLVEKEVESIAVGTKGKTIQIHRNEDSPLYSDKAPAHVTARKKNLLINGVDSGKAPVEVSAPGKTIQINGNTYRGRITLWAQEGKLMAVNTLPIKSYLYGVLPKEMGNLWPPEALKAQAVASRSYTYHTLMNRKSTPGYDLEASTAFQVYAGQSAETPETSRAVDETKGLFLAFQGRPIIACFHANSGGYTEEAEAVWGTPLPYLKSVKDSFSRIAPEPCWEARYSADELMRSLWKKEYKSGAILAMDPIEPTPSGRVRALRLSTTRGRIEIPTNAFRLAVGPTRLKSARFTISREGKTWVFTGCGYGHGVGMSQWGARKMADSGFTFDTILYHYYKAVSLVSIDKDRPH